MPANGADCQAVIDCCTKDGKAFVSAEIPGVDLTDRPVFYKGKGCLKGSYTRVGDSDEPMTEYEVYSYEAYRKKYQDDIRRVQRATLSSLNKEKLALYIDLLKSGKPNLSNMDDESIYELMSVTRNNEITLSATMILVHIRKRIFHSCALLQLLYQEQRLDALAIQERDF